MRGGDLDPTDGQILHPRTAPAQLQIRSRQLNPRLHRYSSIHNPKRDPVSVGHFALTTSPDPFPPTVMKMYLK